MSEVPVSYTHLDVYKRQDIQSVKSDYSAEFIIVDIIICVDRLTRIIVRV